VNPNVASCWSEMVVRLLSVCGRVRGISFKCFSILQTCKNAWFAVDLLDAMVVRLLCVAARRG
jgi:hypothetical protein